jgi:hypothetical protein
MEKFQNAKMVSSPSSSQVYEQSGSSVFIRRQEHTRTFFDSGSRADNRPIFDQLSLARSGFMSASTINDTTLKASHIGRGLGNLPEDRIRKIAKDFVTMYGANGEIPSNGLYRIQR